MKGSELRAQVRTTAIAAPLGIAMLLTLPSGGESATSGTSDVILAASATTEIQINDASVTLSPNQTDYENGYVVAEGAAGIAVQVRSNSSTGMVLSIKSVDGSPGVALADLDFKTQTAAGNGGATISSYTTITGSDQSLWTTTDEQPDWQVVDTDIRVSNLWEYPDAAGGGTTDYTTTLTYTVVVQ